jgi:hypothetical protein
MQVTHDHWNPDLLGDQCVACTPKGRRSGSPVSKQTGQHLALAVAILLIGLASAATAFTVHRHSAAQAANVSVRANASGGPGRVAIAEGRD